MKICREVKNKEGEINRTYNQYFKDVAKQGSVNTEKESDSINQSSRRLFHTDTAWDWERNDNARHVQGRERPGKEGCQLQRLFSGSSEVSRTAF
jgi:hypothetical protein